MTGTHDFRSWWYGSTESSSEGAEEEYSEQYEDEDQTIEPAVKARQTTRDLADGFEKAHKRFMFNVQNLERKYAEREQRGLPESHIEIDRYGNFYFPENMVPSRQQTFVNRMFQYHSLFGKGSVSAPRNSIQSFDGDHQALKRSLQLDEKFGKKERETEQYGNRCQRKKCRIISSSYGKKRIVLYGNIIEFSVSGIPKVEFYSTSSCSSRYNSRYPE
ncbi:CRE-TAG-63 protein [Caenorhabditis remanei]|uniref:CRE-TAG-63 protein n=1 Tax=Caenorhabditis remanei TaxID=31234 RepID=E3LM20_CAERE|nr:CRE-TAG-63 protein [Caenorhabditis remanei]